MLKETPRSLRTYFGIVALLYAVTAAGALSQMALLLRDKPGAQLSALFVSQIIFRAAMSVAFCVVVVKFHGLIQAKPTAIRVLLHANLGGSLLFALIAVIAGSPVNYLGLLLGVLIYVYLLKSVDRISQETTAVQPA